MVRSAREGVMYVKGHIYLKDNTSLLVHEYITFLTNPGSVSWDEVVEDTVAWRQVNADPKTIVGLLGADGDLYINDGLTDQFFFIKFLVWIWFHSRDWDLHVHVDNGEALAVRRTDAGFMWAGQEVRVATATDAMREAVDEVE